MYYDFLFEDGSLFSVPDVWRDVYEQYFQSMPPAAFDERFRFVVGKYMEHQAVPTKFDGIGCAEEGDAKYDDPDYYYERWDDPFGEESYDEPPSMAVIAERVLYQSIRSGLMQKALNDYAAEHGTTPVRVITPEQLQEELERERPDEE